MTAADEATVSRWLEGAPLPADARLLNFVAEPDEPFTLRCHVERQGARLVLLGESDAAEARVTAEELVRLNNEFAAVTRELARRTRALEQAARELSARQSERREPT